MTCLLYSSNDNPIFPIVNQWLQTEALANNPKIEMTADGKFQFKPPFRIKDKKGLLRLLRQHDLKGLGGIMLEDVQESLPQCEKALKVKAAITSPPIIIKALIII